MITMKEAKTVVKNPVSVWSPDNISDGIGDLILCIHESGRYMVASANGRYAPCPPYIRRKQAERYLRENHYHKVIEVAQ